jgi:hypothetical protein
VSLVLVAGALTKVPAEHTLTGVQLAAFVELLNWLGAQALHARSMIALGVLATKVPARQDVHAVHAGALLTIEKDPLAQAIQLRSVIVEPSLATWVPAVHVDLSTHTVPGLPS